ncbi:MAG: selenium cofactor biosynthesis protein YqeC [Bacillota bacterium]|nr:selenium cofactor biosynthesis protein YqeC [Bacillota bacterium]
MLYKTLGLSENEMISVVGGGGKTSIVFRLARELHMHGKNVLISTTTKIYLPQGSDLTIIIEENEELVSQRIFEAASHLRGNKAARILVLGKKIFPDGKVAGVEPETLGRIFDEKLMNYVIIEADGAKQKPIKAPAEYEPLIPNQTRVVLGVIGIDAACKPLTDKFFHRPQIICEKLGYAYGASIDDDLIAFLVKWEQGLFKNVPSSARKVLIINKIDGKEQQKRAERIAGRVIEDNGEYRPDTIILTSAISENPVVRVF